MPNTAESVQAMTDQAEAEFRDMYRKYPDQSRAIAQPLSAYGDATAATVPDVAIACKMWAAKILFWLGTMEHGNV